MTYDPMVDEMSRRPPSRWAEVVRRANVLRRYAAIARPTVDDMIRCAEELGCGQRQAYYYVRAWRARASGLPDPRGAEHAAQSNASSRDGAPGVDAVDRRGPNRIASVRSRRVGTTDGPGRTDPSDRKPDVVVDCAPLAFDVVDGGRIEPALLLALLDAQDGRIVAHALLAHEASSKDAERVLLGWDGRHGARIAWTAGVGDGFDFGRRAALAGAVPIPPGASAVPAGAALLDLAGGTLGRVRISPRRRRPSGSTEAAVPIGAARTTIARIVAERNDAIDLEGDVVTRP